MFSSSITEYPTHANQSIIKLMKQSGLFHSKITSLQAKQLLEAENSANCFFTHGKDKHTLTLYYKAIFAGKVEVRSYNFNYNKKDGYLYPRDKPNEKFFQLEHAAEYITKFLQGFTKFTPVFYRNQAVSFAKEEETKNAITVKINEINAQKNLVKSIIDPLFKKIAANPKITDAKKTFLNFTSCDGICFEACQRYTDNQYFIDVTFLNNITIENLFFDGRNLTIGGFGAEGKPLNWDLVKRISANINELTRDYSTLDLIVDVAKNRI